LKIERLHSMIFKPRDSHRGQATLAEKAQRRLDVCLLDTLVFIGCEQYARECLPDLRDGNPFDPGVSARVSRNAGLYFVTRYSFTEIRILVPSVTSTGLSPKSGKRRNRPCGYWKRTSPVSRVVSMGRCNTLQRVDSTMLAKENHLFGCDLLKPSQGSLSTDLTLASDSSLYFHCRLGSSKCCVDLLRPPDKSGTWVSQSFTAS